MLKLKITTIQTNFTPEKYFCKNLPFCVRNVQSSSVNLKKHFESISVSNHDNQQITLVKLFIIHNNQGFKKAVL